jgi:pilus assembly protein CpaB
MVVAAVLAFIANLAFLRGQDRTVAVAAATRTIESGTVVGAGDLQSVPLDAAAEVLATLIRWEQVSDLTGRVATRTIAAGRLIGPDDFLPVAAAGGLRAMSIPVEPEHAVGGNLVPGDRVDVIAVVDGLAEYVVTDTEVLAVAPGERGALTGTVDFFVVLAVDAETALRLSEAVEGGGVELIRSTGAMP